jgi:outer membrane protein TolC
MPISAPAVLALTALLCACTAPTSPFETVQQKALRRSVVDAAARELADASTRPNPLVTTRTSDLESLGIKPELMPDLEQMAGPKAYDNAAFPLGADLLGRPVQTRVVSLEKLLRSAAENNVAVQFARLGPAISQEQIVAAEAAFDWTFFSNSGYQSIDEATAAVNSFSSPTLNNSQNLTESMGLRRTLVGGGRLTIQQDFSYIDSKSGSNPNPANPVALTLQWDQPLLHGYGSDVSQAEIRTDRNAERNAVQTFRRDLMKVLTDTEKAYWDLVQAKHDVLILQRLLERGEKVRDQIKERLNIDANQSQFADANAQVVNRLANLSRGQIQLRLTSDRLKQLVNDPEFPTGSQVVLIPADEGVDQPIKFSLLESLRSAIQRRPEVQQAVLGIDDASIRQTVAANGRLPDLNLRLQTKWSGLDDDMGTSFGQQFRGNFVDYIVGLSYEAPIGYRKGEADYRRRVLEREQSVLAYHNTIQQVVGEVSSALNRVVLNYELIEESRTSRIAAANVLRVLEVEKQIGPGYTVERLDLELSKQEALAQEERQEMQALVDYNSALADLFLAMGTTLEHDNIQFVAPTTEDVLEGVHGTKGWAGEPVVKTPKPPK